MHDSSSTSPAVAARLVRFPGPLKLRPSRKKWLLVLAGGALFVAGGIWMVRSGEGAGWFVLSFFSLGVFAALLQLLPGAGLLALDREGFEVTTLFRRRRTGWQDAVGFAAARIPTTSELLVAYDDSRYVSKRIGRINVALVGRNAALPDTYGLAAAELAQLMEEWRERALAPT